MTRAEFISKYGKGIERYFLEIDYYNGKPLMAQATPSYPGSRYDGSRTMRWNPTYKRTLEEFLNRIGFDPSVMELSKEEGTMYLSIFLDRLTDKVVVEVRAA